MGSRDRHRVSGGFQVRDDRHSIRSYSSDTQILECEATPSINEGTFTVEDASGTDTTDRVVIPEDGLYELIVSLYVDNGTGTRTTPHVSFTVETGGVVTTLDDEGTGYIRGSQGGQDEGAVDHTSIVELDEDDRIGPGAATGRHPEYHQAMARSRFSPS